MNFKSGRKSRKRVKDKGGETIPNGWSCNQKVSNFDVKID